MNTQHTPGPWRTINASKGGQTIWHEDNDEPRHRKYIADIAPSDTMHADAALIAAAPDLLEALETCLNFWDAPRPTFGLNQQRKAELNTIQAQARAAIAQATGGDK